MITQRSRASERDLIQLRRAIQQIDANQGLEDGFIVVSTDYTLTLDDKYIICTDELVITLPTAVGNESKTYYIKNAGDDVDEVTVTPYGSQTIDEEDEMIILHHSCMAITSDDSNWHII